MGILNSFHVGVTGLKATGEAMTITADNIANAGTTGFKKSRGEFQDVLATSLKGIDGGDQLGAGTKLAHITPVYTQGSIIRTDSVTDLAVNGDGFFMIEAPFGRGFTRDGTFHFDKEGKLINGDGYRVVGFEANEAGDITNKTGAVSLGRTVIAAKATAEIKIDMNLDSRSEIIQFDIKDPENTSNYNNSVLLYDNVGTPRLATAYFNRTGPNQWAYRVAVDGKDVDGGKEGTMVEMGKGKMIFSNKGLLQEEVVDKDTYSFNKGAAPNQKIKFNFGISIKEGGEGNAASTQYGSDSTIARHSQDGSTAATLASLSFTDKGILLAVYDNGATRNIAQIGLAKFENNEGLFKKGRNLFKESRKSGQAAFDKPGAGGRGLFYAKSQELSNVDIANEFVDLMTNQRNFTANSKVIQTADQMLQEVLNIKR